MEESPTKRKRDSLSSKSPKKVNLKLPDDFEIGKKHIYL